MKRPIVRYFDENDKSTGGLSFPATGWTVKQEQVSYALSQFVPSYIVHHNIYIAYHYGECPNVIEFAKFFLIIGMHVDVLLMIQVIMMLLMKNLLNGLM